MNGVVKCGRCLCGNGHCQERHGHKIPGCMARCGGSDGDLLPRVSPQAHPELEQHLPPIEERKQSNE